MITKKKGIRSQHTLLKNLTTPDYIAHGSRHKGVAIYRFSYLAIKIHVVGTH